MSKSKSIGVAAALTLAVAFAPAAWAHAFPQVETPASNAKVTAPKLVKIRFTGDVEPVFSTLIVKDAAGKQVSLKKGEVLPNHKDVMVTQLPTKLPAGEYTVYWSVVAQDGHHTHGHYEFSVK